MLCPTQVAHRFVSLLSVAVLIRLLGEVRTKKAKAEGVLALPLWPPRECLYMDLSQAACAPPYFLPVWEDLLVQAG